MRGPRRRHAGVLSLLLALLLALLVVVLAGGCAGSQEGGSVATPGDETVGPPSPPAAGSSTPSSTPPSTPPGTPPPGAPPPAQRTTPSAADDLPALPLPGKLGTTRTLRGTVALGVEVRCLLLQADGTVYNLVATGPERALLQPGRQVEVTGQVRPDIMTTCQEGQPFLVVSARAL